MDEFNLKGLSKHVTNFKKILFTILDLEQSGNILLIINCLNIESDTEMAENKEETRKNSIFLFGLIHARYIQTTKGMKKMV